MLKQFLQVLAGLVLSITFLQAQTSGAPEAHSFRFIGSNHLWPLENVDDLSLDDFRPGLEYEYFRYLNDFLDFSLPVRVTSKTFGLNDTGNPNRKGFNVGLNGLLNLNFYKGKTFRPRLFAGIGGNYMDIDELTWDVPVGLGLNWYLGRNTSLGTTFAYHINGADFQNHAKVGLGLRLHLEDEEEKPPVVTDRDGDGILDTEDLCPDTPGLAALNGCPDKDGDGITDANDKCPDVAGISQFDGCPDTDGDGLQDSDDDCPDVAGPVDNKGCPITDRDGDGVNDEADACPDVAGPVANNGCPETSLTVTAKDKITNENIPGVQVQVVDASGNVVHSGVTDAQGRLEIAGIAPGSYTVNGKILDVDLDGASINSGDFNGDSVQKTIFYDDPNFIIQGKVFYCNSPRPLSGTNINLKGKGSNFLKSTRSDDEGRYIFYLDSKETYELYAQRESFLSQVVDINPSDYNRSTSVFVRLEVCADEVECGEAVRLDNILYDTGSAAIRSDAMPDLNRVVQFLRDNKDAKVELSSHTDSRGGADSNMRLSQRRAQSAADYIIAQGISNSRVIGTGYGETRLLNRCADGVRCSNDEHQVNRRTEFKVICPD